MIQYCECLPGRGIDIDNCTVIRGGGSASIFGADLLQRIARRVFLAYTLRSWG